MPEREGGEYSPLPEPEDIFRGIERELGIPINQEPDWSFAPTKEQLFEGEAPSHYQRKIAASVLHNFYFFQSRPPGQPGEPGEPGEEPATVEDLAETFNDVREEYRAGWNDPDPFPDVTLEHALGATRRQIAWLEEQRAFEETNSYDRSIQEYYSIHSLVEQAQALALSQDEQTAQEGVLERVQSTNSSPGDPQRNVDQDSDEKRVERLVAAIEDDIRAASPHLGERFPLFLPSPSHKLLPDEADTDLARALSFLCSDAMLRLVDQRKWLTQRDPASQIPPLNEADIEDYFQEYQQNEPVSYTLNNVLAATKRRLLSRHLGRDRRLNVVDRELYQNTILVHELLTKAVISPEQS